MKLWTQTAKQPPSPGPLDSFPPPARFLRRTIAQHRCAAIAWVNRPRRARDRLSGRIAIPAEGPNPFIKDIPKTSPIDCSEL